VVAASCHMSLIKHRKPPWLARLALCIFIALADYTGFEDALAGHT
jgi:hypothetical protein